MVSPADIQGYIAQGLPCEHLSVDGDGAHFEAVIVSSVFEGKSRIQRQQAVYKALGGRMESGEVHALSMRTLTPEEWRQQNG
ncbi:MAG: BolA family transcriptional regulator [Rhodocyclaceae bacterium]|nr:BolA family transcriptional regulator [Rhodocyclaceae bacterium]PKO69262.1 MAG: BolA family transcriptional regulator [Betaproteobacteria bacterium HGW-Betaproteobacteria-14]MBX3678228.1 BolA family transcriptional regulator [Rhodocyclaceae bacterium]MCB1891989.1 BolA family transcriptional regulator [Rhodocyclaceae bacterium]MCO5097739.1 BolA family transcriptional regulator [Rhodocyclaceae bacterium]